MGKVVALLPPPKLLSFVTFITRIAFQLDAYRPLAYRISQHALHRGGCLAGGVCHARGEGVSLPGGVSLRGGSALQGGGVLCRGGLPCQVGLLAREGVVSQHVMGQTPPCEQNHRRL